MLSILQIILALGLLFLGRRLYWFVVAAFGFIAATQWAGSGLQGQPEWVALLIGLAVGVVGALLAVYLRVIGIGVAGFLGGALLTSALLSMFGVPQETLFTVFTIIGGVLGVVLMFVVFDWALILLSAVSGAAMLANAITLEAVPTVVIAVVLAVLGVIVQSRDLETTAT